jgi:putative Holliday junction resolvase
VIVTTRTGVRLAVDVGAARVGVAASDAEGRLAFPVTVLKRDRRAQQDMDALVALVDEREAVEVLVGLPQTLRGRDSSSTADARAYAAVLAERVQPVPVRLVDERLSTVSAQQQLHAAGLNTKQSRQMIDAAAAVVLLETALDRERNTGAPAGEQVLP